MASNYVLENLDKFPCGPGGHDFSGGESCPKCPKTEVPHLTCLFCNLDGVERYGGVCDEHTVRDADGGGSREATGPICGNCHVVVYDKDRDSGGWVIMKDGAPLLA